MESTPLELQLGLRGSVLGVDTPGASGAVTGLWLQVSEVEFITCSGLATASPRLEPGDNLAVGQTLPVLAPDEPICAVIVRTTQLDTLQTPNLPPGGAGMGAVVEGTDALGAEFSALVPERITSVLTPANASFTLGEAESLRLTIEDGRILQAVTTYGDTMGVAAEPNAYDSSTAPVLVEEVARQLRLGFSLERLDSAAAQPEVLATSTLSLSEVDDLLCSSECALQDRTSCPSTPCDVQACLNQTLDPLCGESFRSALYCRVGMTPEEYSCVDGTLSVVNSDCALPVSTYETCGGP